MQPLLTTRTLYWIITNTSITDTTWSSYSLLLYLLPFLTNRNWVPISPVAHIIILWLISFLLQALTSLELCLFIFFSAAATSSILMHCAGPSLIPANILWSHSFSSLFVIFWIFWNKMNITQADAPTIRITATPSWLIGAPTSAIPPFLCRMPFMAQPSQFIPAWAGTKYAGLHTRLDTKITNSQKS